MSVSHFPSERGPKTPSRLGIYPLPSRGLGSVIRSPSGVLGAESQRLMIFLGITFAILCDFMHVSVHFGI